MVSKHILDLSGRHGRGLMRRLVSILIIVGLLVVGCLTKESPVPIKVYKSEEPPDPWIELKIDKWQKRENRKEKSKK